MSAIFSACGRYRHRLDRVDLAPTGLTFLFCGINPSKAGAEIEDQTTMKWRGFTIHNGGARYIAINPFGYCATDVKELAQVEHPVGDMNPSVVDRAIREADVLVPCWGNRSKVPQRLRHHLDAMLELFRLSGKPVKCFGTTLSGDPKHPLMLGYATPLTDWSFA